MESFSDDDIEKILKDGPPLRWYFGVGFMQKGISGVGFSQEFFEMDQGKTENYVREWSHYTANPVTENSSPEEIGKSREALTRGVDYVKKVTGFTPEQIVVKASELTRIFRGEKVGTF